MRKISKKWAALPALLVTLVLPWAHAMAAVLPPHEPLRIVVIADKVNPNSLKAEELTEPEDFVPALTAADSGINTVPQGVILVDSQKVAPALEALASSTPPHVVVYFAHRPSPMADQQQQLVMEFEAHLKRGGGIVVFHHGIYSWSGKEATVALLGGHSDSIQWDTSTGQRVFNIAPNHFVTSQGVTYEGMAALNGLTNVKDGTYAYFDNTPDERYPMTTLTPTTGETRELLFASDSGGKRILGYALTRPGWKGRVVTYQPGEYQPHALDDRKGANFQILANAILYSTGRINAEGQALPDGAASNGSSAPPASAAPSTPPLGSAPAPSIIGSSLPSATGSLRPSVSALASGTLPQTANSAAPTGGQAATASSASSASSVAAGALSGAAVPSAPTAQAPLSDAPQGAHSEGCALRGMPSSQRSPVGVQAFALFVGLVLAGRRSLQRQS